MILQVLHDQTKPTMYEQNTNKHQMDHIDMALKLHYLIVFSIRKLLISYHTCCW